MNLLKNSPALALIFRLAWGSALVSPMFRMAIGFCCLAACKMNLYPGEFSSQDLSRNNKVRLKLGNESMNHGLYYTTQVRVNKIIVSLTIFPNSMSEGRLWGRLWAGRGISTNLTLLVMSFPLSAVRQLHPPYRSNGLPWPGAHWLQRTPPRR